jgi:hypothetical protein
VWALTRNYIGCKPLIAAVRADDSAVMGAGMIEGRGDQKILGRNISWWRLSDQARDEHNEQNIPRLIQTSKTKQLCPLWYHTAQFSNGQRRLQSRPGFYGLGYQN